MGIARARLRIGEFLSISFGYDDLRRAMSRLGRLVLFAFTLDRVVRNVGFVAGLHRLV